MTPEEQEASQVFASNRLRTEGEQKAYIMQQRSNAAKPIVSKPWTIRGSKVIINGVEFTRKELAGIVAQMD